METIKATLLTLALGYVTVVLLLYLFQRNLMYMPGVEEGLPAASSVPEMTVAAIQAADGNTSASWYAPPTPGNRVIVFFHGNAGNIADRDYKARYFIDEGVGVLLVGYRGFGGNPGKPTEAGIYADAKAAAEFLITKGITPADMVLYGESMGSGVAVDLARKMADSGTPVGGVILEAPFTSMADAAAYHYSWLPARLLVRDRYDSLKKIAGINTSLMLIHGDQDRTVPQPLGKTLFSEASEPKEALWLAGAGHVNIYDFDVVPPMMSWLESLP